MRKYLNAYERETIALSAIVIERLKDFPGEGDEKKWLRTAVTYFNKWFYKMLARIGAEEAKKVLRIVEGNDLAFQTKPIRGIDARKDLVIAADSVYDIAVELLDSHCVGCCGKDSCAVRDMLDALQIPAVSFTDMCKYQTPKGGAK